VTAVAGAPLIGETRKWAEARCRVAAGLTVLSAGIPMFFMGEEMGAEKLYRYDDFARNKEDIVALRNGTGSSLFAFYRDLVRLSRSHAGLRSRDIDSVHAHDENRVIAFRRWRDEGEFLIVASLADQTCSQGYTIGNERLPDGQWAVILDSDNLDYGGWSTLEDHEISSLSSGAITMKLPASSLLVLHRVRAG
jgi:1,4-alpha-glucan branching enzyme